MADLAPEYLRELLIRFSLEAVFVSACLLFAWGRLGWRRTFARLGRRRGAIAVALVAALTVVQLVDRWQYQFPPRFSFYPLARFAMYQTGTIDEAGILTYRFVAVTDGDEEEIDLTERFSAVGLPSLNTRFRVIGERLLSGEAGDSLWAEEQIRLYGASIARQLRARGEAVPEAIDFELLRFPVGTVRPEGGELLRRIRHLPEEGAP